MAGLIQDPRQQQILDAYLNKLQNTDQQKQQALGLIKQPQVQEPYLQKWSQQGLDPESVGMAGMGSIENVGGALESKAAKLLKEIDTPEKAVALKGDARSEYLNALDSTYGPQANRAKDMGFGDKTWYHGTSVPIEEFKPEAKGLSTNAQSAKQGYFFAKDPETATQYADLAGNDHGVIREGDRVTTKHLSDTYSEPEKLGYNHYQNKKGVLDDLMTRESQEVDRLNSLKRWQKAVDEKADWLTQGAAREGMSPEDWVAKKTARLQEPIKKASAKEIKAAQEDYYQSLKDFAATNDPGYVSKIFGIDMERLSEKQKKPFLDAMAHGEDINTSNGQNVLPVRLKGDPLVKNYKGENYRDESYANVMKSAQDAGKDSVYFKNTYDAADPHNKILTDVGAVFNPNQIRSVNAAFDPRFKKSGLIMAGAAGALTSQQLLDQYLDQLQRPDIKNHSTLGK